MLEYEITVSYTAKKTIVVTGDDAKDETTAIEFVKRVIFREQRFLAMALKIEITDIKSKEVPDGAI